MKITERNSKMITSVGLPRMCPITAPMPYHARYAVQSKPVVENRVGNPRAHRRAITARITGTAVMRMS